MTARTDAEVAELIRRVEAEHELFAPLVDGWSAWQLLRFPVAARLLRDTPQAPTRDDPGAEASGATDWWRYARLPRARVFAKTFVSGLVEPALDGTYRDVFFDDVLEVAGPFVKVEAQNARPRRAQQPAAAGTAGIELGARLLARLRPPDLSDTAARLAEVIDRELEIDGFDRETIARRLAAFHWARRLYGRLLDRVRPEVVLVADTSEFELFAAAKERGIRTVELQHGIFSRHHPDALGAAAVGHRVIVPDALLLFGDHWADELRAGGFYDDELRVVGSLRIDRYRARRERAERTGPPRVLVTSQGVATAELARFLAAAFSGARACRVDVKLHPIYDGSSRKTFEAALAGLEHVRVLAADEGPPTLELLSQADAHVSISSAAHFEALGLGVPTIVVPLAGHEEVLPLVTAGHASLAATPEDLARLAADARARPVPDEVSGRYYRRGALERIAGEVGHPSNAGSRT